MTVPRRASSGPVPVPAPVPGLVLVLMLHSFALQTGRARGTTAGSEDGEDIVSLLQLQQASPSRDNRSGTEVSKKPVSVLWLKGHGVLDFDNSVEGDDDLRHHLVMNHLAKAGGTTLKSFLRDVIPGDLLHVEHEEEEVTEDDLKPAAFVIGLVRNPFDYYVSMWSYFSHYPHAIGWPKYAMTAEQRRTLFGEAPPWGNTPDQRARFRRWLFAMNSPELGLESLKFYGSFLSHVTEQGRLVERWNFKNTFDPSVRNVTSAVNEALADFETSRLAAKPGPVNCWVHTESLEDDLHHCLQRFEQEAGSPVVDWDRFESKRGKRYMTSDHAPCVEFYDNESLALVKEADKHIISAFGYPPHCA